jgi:hypothetical protein
MFFGVGGDRRATVLPDDDSTGEAFMASIEAELIRRRLK